MKKLIFYLTAVLCALTSSAQGWVVPSSQEYDKEHVIYATIDGLTADAGYVVGAFIDGECRAYESVKMDASGPSTPLRYELRVRGSSEDAGSQISFKVFRKDTQSTYSLTQTLAYIPEGTTGMPSDLYILNFVPAEIFHFTPAEVQLYPRSTYEIAYSVTPEGAQVPDGFNDNFYVAQKDEFISIRGKTITALKVGSAFVTNTTEGIQCGNTELFVNVVDAPIPVESISINSNMPTTIYVGDQIDLNEYFSILPANASNKDVTVTADNDNVTIGAPGADAAGLFLTANAKGTTVVTITSDEAPAISAQITFTIKQHVESVTPNKNANFTLNVGQTINLADYYIITPADADNKDVTVDVGNYASWVKATGSGTNWQLEALKAGTVVVTVTSVDNLKAIAFLEFEIVQLATGITVTPNSFDICVGEELDCYSQMQIEILPAGVSQLYTLSTDKPEVVEVHNAVERSPYLVGLSKGTATVTVTANDGSNVSATFTVNVYPTLIGFTTDVTELTMASMSTANITLTPNPIDALLKETPDFDITAPDVPAKAWKYVDGNLTANPDGSYNLALTAYSMGEGQINLTYGQSGAITIPAIPLHVGFEYELSQGWNWMSVFSDGESTASQTMQQMLGDKLVVARTQEGLLYNDPVYGYFGDFTDFGNTEMMYKIKSNADSKYMLFGNNTNSTLVCLNEGWNWIPYNCEYDQAISLNGNEGDIILSLTDGLATYTDYAWAPADFTLKAGQGYLYYSTATRELSLPEPYLCDQSFVAEAIAASEGDTPQQGAPGRKAGTGHWTYNPRLYNTIMPIIAEIDGYDTDNFTVGAFVGEECRGEGRLVDGKWFLTVAGERGEQVSFRIYDKTTGNTVDVVTTVTMSSLLGSAKAPVSLFADNEITSIRSIEADGDSQQEYYDLCGRRVKNPGKGIYIINGTKVIVK